MANEIKDAKDGLASLIDNISGLRVIDYPSDALNQFPVAVILFTGRSLDVTLAGSTFLGEITVKVLVAKGNQLEAFDELDKYMEATSTESIEAAVDADNTWNGKVDDGRLRSITNVGIQEFPGGGRYVAADFNFTFIKQVTS